MSLHTRLLRDIAEMEQHPYPNVQFITYEQDMTKACLILTPPDQEPLHFTVTFHDNYPIRAPHINIQTIVSHPNVFEWSGGYICASILNTNEDWTCAYTMKGIAIQLLSFFCSDKLEQSYGGTADLTRYQDHQGRWLARGDAFKCTHCTFDNSSTHKSSSVLASLGDLIRTMSPRRRRRSGRSSGRSSGKSKSGPATGNDAQVTTNGSSQDEHQDRDTEADTYPSLQDMPDEIILHICEQLEDEDLMLFMQSWNYLGGNDGLMANYNLLRNRELKCFLLKESFDTEVLGVGVRTNGGGRQKQISSEFDVLSKTAFEEHKIRQSVQGAWFNHWLPLPISRRHYDKVAEEAKLRLSAIGTDARIENVYPAKVIVSFMSDIVVKLCDKANETSDRSVLARASERAIESYFHLFHLLLCLAVENPTLVSNANKVVQGVLNKKTSKDDIPNLGHLLINVLIADVDMTPPLLKAIIKEAITRNVVWMLDSAKGKCMTELAYLEGNEVSQYRLTKTYEASRTSYTLLMFQNTFRRMIDRGVGAQRKSLVVMCDELFKSHGAPPRGAAGLLAKRIRDLQAVDTFPKFIQIMGVETPNALYFTNLLRSCVVDSMNKGYSSWGISQAAAWTLRKDLDPEAQERKTWPEELGGKMPGGPATMQSFFPGKRRARNDQQGRRGRGRGR
jgi:ubiquitin-protein ligase